MAIITRASKGSALTHNEMDNNLTELEQSPNGKVFPATQNAGVKLDPNSPAFGWHDMVGYLYTDTTYSGSASLATYRGGIRALYFDEEQKEALVDFHMPHDYVMGTTIYIHAHWSHNATTVSGGSVTWAFELMYAKGHDQAAFSAPVIPSVVHSADPTQYWHSVAEVAASTPGGSLVALDTDDLEVDGIIQCRVYLDSNDIAVTSGPQVWPYLHFVDIHYQSTGIPTPNRAPSFWG